MKTNSPHRPSRYTDQLYPSFKVFHELMAWKVQNILLVSSPYDAFIMEEDGRLAGRIIDEYRGLNLSRPPRLSWVSTAREALDALSHTPYDIVITMPHLDDMPPHELGRKIKSSFPNLPVFLLTHAIGPIFGQPGFPIQNPFDKIYVWSGNTDLLLALIKNVEDRMNVEFDTQHALVRVILLMEDSPVHASAIIPMLYREIVTQTQRVMEESINEEHRLLRMRARTKILVAETYEEAEKLYRQFTPYLLCVISDVRFSKNGKMDDTAGISFLSMIRKENPDISLLPSVRRKATGKKSPPFQQHFLIKTLPRCTWISGNFSCHTSVLAILFFVSQREKPSVARKTCGRWKKCCRAFPIKRSIIMPPEMIFPSGSWPGPKSSSPPGFDP
jgi:CheY-like chemotaxis protein